MIILSLTDVSGWCAAFCRSVSESSRMIDQIQMPPFGWHLYLACRWLLISIWSQASSYSYVL